MGRIPEIDRLPMIDEHLSHWQQADALAGTPIEIVTGYGRTQLQAQRDAYHAKAVQIQTLDETTLPAVRGERDAIFGLNAEAVNGVWIRLTQYKAMVQALLGANHPLARSVPNLGVVTPGEYINILHRFLPHWPRVNTALGAPMTLGTFTLANLQTVHDNLDLKIDEVTDAETELGLGREQREVLIGDVPSDKREQAAIIARLELYHAVIEARFPGQPIATTLPRIFPEGGPALPRFDFKNSTLAPGQEKTLVKDPSLPNAAVVYFKEGAFEQTQPYSATPGSTNAFTWSGVTVVDGLDAMELRDADGRTIARGTFNAGLVEV